MLTKIKVLESLKEMPDTFSVDEFIERIIILNKIETGLEQAAAGKILTEEEADKRLGQWLE